MKLSRIAIAGFALVAGAVPSLAGDLYRLPDFSRYHSPEEQLVHSLPRDITGRYPRPAAVGADTRIPVGAYMPVPPNAFDQERRYGLGEAAVGGPRKGYRVYKGYRDAKGYARHDVRRRDTAWAGERGARRAFVD